MDFELVEYYEGRPDGTSAEFSAPDIASAMRRASVLIERGGSFGASWVLYTAEGEQLAHYSRAAN